MAQQYLKKYADRVADVPGQLQRLFKLIRDLDERVATLQGEVDEKVTAQLAAAAATRVEASPGKRPRTGAGVDTTAETSPLNAEIEAGMQKVLGLAEEKVKIAAQVYDLMDGHIRALDEDLRVFNEEVVEGRTALKLPDGETASARLGAPLSGAGADRVPGHVRQKRKYTRRKGVVPPPPGATPAPAPAPSTTTTTSGPGLVLTSAPEPSAAVDPSEPRYCLCNNISYGNMVACENQDCLIEWFHFDCVGIQTLPKGKWYCPQCTALGFGSSGMAGAALPAAAQGAAVADGAPGGPGTKVKRGRGRGGGGL